MPLSEILLEFPIKKRVHSTFDVNVDWILMINANELREMHFPWTHEVLFVSFEWRGGKGGYEERQTTE